MDFPNFVLQIISSLNAAGYDAFAVGGCVRDSVLGVCPNDWDIATAALPDQVLRVFSEHPFSVRCGTGLRHGTVTVIVRDGDGIFSSEVTTFRCDGSYTDRRRPDSVSFVSDIESDLGRRDFTINAMAADRNGVIDPYGGRDDLCAGVIRCVGDPRERFSEDPLRILRALRFAGRLGFRIESSCAEAMKELCASLRFIAKERIADELRGLLLSPHADSVLKKYSTVLFCALELDMPKKTFPVSASDDLSVRFSLLFGENAPALSRKLKMSADFIRRTEALSGAKALPRSRAELMRLMREYPRYYVSMIEFAGILSGNRHGARRALEEAEGIISSGECFDLRSLNIGGNDLYAIGFRGRSIGQVLEALLSSVCSGELENTKDILIKKAEEIYKEGGADVLGERS